MSAATALLPVGVTVSAATPLGSPMITSEPGLVDHGGVANPPQGPTGGGRRAALANGRVVAQPSPPVDERDDAIYARLTPLGRGQRPAGSPPKRRRSPAETGSARRAIAFRNSPHKSQTLPGGPSKADPRGGGEHRTPPRSPWSSPPGSRSNSIVSGGGGGGGSMAWQARSPNHSLDLTITGKARRRALSEERRRDVVSRHTMQGMRVPVAGVVVAEAIYLPSEAGGRVATCAIHFPLL